MPPIKQTTAVTIKSQQLPVQSMEDLALLGKSIAQSGMFGVRNDGAGMVLAVTCLQEGISFMDFKRTYHIVDGSPTMRADAMLADFAEKYNGEYWIIKRTSECAEIKLKRGDKEYSEAFTWETAKNEKYCYCKDGKTLKDNWSTPRRQMQMLWARVVSDSLRAFCPQVVKGTYTPEEMHDAIDVQATSRVEVEVNPERAAENIQPKQEVKVEIKDAEIVSDPEPTQDVSQIVTEAKTKKKNPIQTAKEPQQINYSVCPVGPDGVKGTKWMNMETDWLKNALDIQGVPEMTEEHKNVIREILKTRDALTSSEVKI